MGDIPLIDRSEVVLNFPFKDCILEGGQRKEDGLDTYFEYELQAEEYSRNSLNLAVLKTTCRYYKRIYQ